MTTITISQDLIKNVDIQPLVPYIDWCEQNKHYFVEEPGKEHYRFLAYMSTCLGTCPKMIDIGTNFGFSAAAMSFNEKAKVIAYDIFDWIPDEGVPNTIKNKSNIETRIMDCMEDVENLLDADFICLDVSPHDGLQEAQIYNMLKRYKYKGILYVNNLLINTDMKEFHSNISHTTIDVTKYAHFTGSSLVVFDPYKYNVVLD